MLTLPILAKVSSAAVAAALTATMTYGQYTVTSGADGPGLMPPASILRPNAPAGDVMDPFAEIAQALAALKLDEAKTRRNRAMIDWLVSLQAEGPADFTVQRLERGLVYAVRYVTADGQDSGRQDYVAVPYGPEMPFAVSLRTNADGSVRMEGYSCTARETLGTVAASAGPETAQAEALSQAGAYLAAPDAADLSLPADCLIEALGPR